MKRILFLAIAIVASVQLTKAQDDELSTFHASKSKGKSNDVNVDAANAVYINIGSCLRGASTMGYQRHLVSGLAAYAELGVVVNDYIGRMDFSSGVYQSGTSYFESTEAYRLGRVLSLGSKYYFDQNMGGTYLGLDYTNFNIVNTMAIPSTLLSSSSTSLYPTDQVRLPYISNEYKLLLGVSSSESNFYSDVNMGFGFRKVAYKEITSENFIYNSNSSALIYNTGSFEKMKLWFFFALKMGYKF